jgi:peptidoglycan/LPS O-acetylase OafA/YrhL
MQRESFLDLIRFAAAFGVLAFHFGFRGWCAHGLQDIDYPELAGFSKYGYMGVEIFFMISGYVIPWSVRGRSVGEFVVSRAIRLYPTYWLCAALLLFVPPLLGDPRFLIPARDALMNVTMVAPWFGSPYIDPVFWSLARELEFYALVAFVVGLLGFERLPKALLVWLLIGVGTSVLAIGTGKSPVYLGGTYYMYFCFGAACYFLQHLERSRTVYALLVLSLPLMLAHSLHKASVVTEIYRVTMSPFVVCAVLAAGAAAVYFSSALSERMKPSALVTFIGGLTYPLYLLHENIGYALLNTMFSEETRWLGLAYTVLFCVAASAAVYLWFDLPVRRWLRRSLRQQLGFRH